MPPKRAQIPSQTTTGVPPIPKNTSTSPTSSTSTTTTTTTSPSSKTSSSSSHRDSGANQSPQQVLQTLWENYQRKTPQRTKLLDVFMGFLLVVGAVQFLYCLIVGNYPFNAFLAGFSATVGQFVLTASLRIQTNPENEKEFLGSISHERAFADFVVGSLILHFFCVNFIN